MEHRGFYHKIRNKNYRCLYWSNSLGWGTIYDADSFSEEEKNTVCLPLEGEWITFKSQMGPKTERTPGEWETSFNGKDWDICMEGGGDMIADLKDCPNAEANAAFIVKACNLHEDLLEGLKLALTLNGNPRRDSEDNAEWDKVIDNIKNLIAKAGEVNMTALT